LFGEAEFLLLQFERLAAERALLLLEERFPAQHLVLLGAHFEQLSTGILLVAPKNEKKQSLIDDLS
jgi:hypothetical protein